jgi:hypothetical protein
MGVCRAVQSTLPDAAMPPNEGWQHIGLSVTPLLGKNCATLHILGLLVETPVGLGLKKY